MEDTIFHSNKKQDNPNKAFKKVIEVEDPYYLPAAK